MKNFKTVIVTTVALTVICTVAALALAFTNDYTKDRIAAEQKKTEQAAMSRVIEAESYDETGTVTRNGTDFEYVVAKSGGKTVGYLFTVANKGYGGDVKVMVGIGTDGKIIAAEVLDASSETPGLGQNAAKKDFWGQFAGKTAGMTVTKSGDGQNAVKAVTGATITSNSVAASVNEAIELFGLIDREAK